MSFTTDLLTGLAQRLHDGGAGTYKATGAYTEFEIGIVFAALPDKPDRVITLSAYAVSDDLTLSDSVTGVQVRCRASRDDPHGCDAIGDAVFDLLHGDWTLTAGGIRVVTAERVSSAPLGRDGNGRHERTDNYYLSVHRPSPNRS